MKKRKISPITVLRLIIQILCFVFLPGLFISTFSGLKLVYLNILHGSFRLSAMLPQLVEAIAVLPVTVIAGRYFCGWMCAFGALGDLVFAVFGRALRLGVKVNEKADRILKFAKYAVLAALVSAVWTWGFSAFKAANPWDAFGMLFTFGKAPDLIGVLQNLLPAFLLLIAILAASAFIERFFCRYLCPLGAVFSIISLPKLLKIRKPNARCGSCRICTNHCAMGIPLYQKSTVNSGECIGCLKCLSACPRKNVSLAAAGEDIRPALASVMAAGAIAGIYGTGMLAVRPSASAVLSVGSTQPARQSSSASETAQAGGAQSAAETGQAPASSQTSSKYKDGTYEGSGTGFRGSSTTVSVTVKSGKISDIQVVSYGDDEQFFSRAYSAVTEEILKTQSSSVDAVTGATFSSDGIMQAVADALAKAEN